MASISKKSSRESLRFVVLASLAAFITYFCMYAFRKPFSAATYEGLTLWGFDYKILLILAQVLGYMLSKFLGISVVSSMPPQKRIAYLLIFIGLAELALLGFAVFPYQYGWLFLFLNGLPLGMIWGIVFSFLEGRKVTELLAAILSASFIVSSGTVKSTGKWLMLDFQVSEMWMPFITGLVYMPLLLLGAWMLSKITPPTTEEIKLRHERKPMTGSDRKKMLMELGPSLVMLLLVYLFLTAYRDFRDNFAADMWVELGYSNSSKILAITEIPVTLLVLATLGLLYKIKNNQSAVRVNYYLIATGGALIWLSSWLLKFADLSPVLWVILTGAGVYLAYVPFGSMLFERILAVVRQNGNAGFLIYVADSVGYLGSICILLIKNFMAEGVSAYKFLVNIGLYVGWTPIVIMLASVVVFNHKYAKRKRKELVVYIN